MSDAAGGAALLGRDYWLVLSSPSPSCTAQDVADHLHDHLAWMLALEAQGTVLLSGPLLEGPGAGPGSGVTVLRAPDAEAARALVAGDPFVRAGLRSTAVYRWRVNEGSIGVTVSLGTGSFTGR